MIVSDAIAKLTPSSENNTVKYLADLKKQGINIDATVKPQIDDFVLAVQKNEGLIKGVEVPRS
jgi:hypothetical protein